MTPNMPNVWGLGLTEPAALEIEPWPLDLIAPLYALLTHFSYGLTQPKAEGLINWPQLTILMGLWAGPTKIA